MTRLVCGVSEGDLPLEFKWLKNGRVLSQQWTNDIEISNLDSFSTMLRFSSLSEKESGIYTCKINNSFSESEFSAKLSVQGW